MSPILRWFLALGIALTVGRPAAADELGGFDVPEEGGQTCSVNTEPLYRYWGLPVASAKLILVERPIDPGLNPIHALGSLAGCFSDQFFHQGVYIVYYDEAGNVVGVETASLMNCGGDRDVLDAILEGDGSGLAGIVTIPGDQLQDAIDAINSVNKDVLAKMKSGELCFAWNAHLLIDNPDPLGICAGKGDPVINCRTLAGMIKDAVEEAVK